MITTLLIGSMFLVLILIAVLVLHISMRGWIHKAEEMNRERFEKLSERVEEVKALFVKEVKTIISKVKDITDY